MATKQPDCYFPNGSVGSDDPCFPDAEVSSCCTGAWSCLANGLCYDPELGLARGTCTDPTWKSADCPQYCVHNDWPGTDALDFSGLNVGVRNCTDRWVAGWMCCDVTNFVDCCRESIDFFTLGPRSGKTKSGISSSLFLLSTTTVSPVFSSIADPVVESLDFNPTSRSSSISGSRSTSSFSPESNFSPTSSFRPTSSSAPTAKEPTVNGQTIAIAVSASTGSITLIILGFLIYQFRRRRTKREHQLNQNASENQTVNNLLQNPDRVYQPGEIHEISGLQEHELAENQRSITQELQG